MSDFTSNDRHEHLLRRSSSRAFYRIRIVSEPKTRSFIPPLPLDSPPPRPPSLRLPRKKPRMDLLVPKPSTDRPLDLPPRLRILAFLAHNRRPTPHHIRRPLPLTPEMPLPTLPHLARQPQFPPLPNSRAPNSQSPQLDALRLAALRILLYQKTRRKRRSDMGADSVSG